MGFWREAVRVITGGPDTEELLSKAILSNNPGEARRILEDPELRAEFGRKFLFDTIAQLKSPELQARYFGMALDTRTLSPENFAELVRISDQPISLIVALPHTSDKFLFPLISDLLVKNRQGLVMDIISEPAIQNLLAPVIGDIAHNFLLHNNRSTDGLSADFIVPLTQIAAISPNNLLEAVVGPDLDSNPFALKLVTAVVSGKAAAMQSEAGVNRLFQQSLMVREAGRQPILEALLTPPLLERISTVNIGYAFGNAALSGKTDVAGVILDHAISRLSGQEMAWAVHEAMFTASCSGIVRAILDNTEAVKLLRPHAERLLEELREFNPLHTPNRSETFRSRWNAPAAGTVLDYIDQMNKAFPEHAIPREDTVAYQLVHRRYIPQEAATPTR